MNKRFDEEWLLAVLDEDDENGHLLEDSLTGESWEDGLTEEHLLVFKDPESGDVRMRKFRMPAFRAFLVERELISKPDSAHLTREALIEAMLAETIPIYWGDPLVGRDFDTRSFLSAHDSPSLDDLVDRVVAVDQDPALRRELCRHPWYRDNQVPACVDPAKVLAHFARIFNTPLLPVARRRDLLRLSRLDQLPATIRSLRRRILGKYRKLTAEARP